MLGYGLGTWQRDILGAPTLLNHVEGVARPGDSSQFRGKILSPWLEDDIVDYIR